MKKHIFILLWLLLLYSCTTSKTVVSQNVNLSRYEYASIINNDTYHIPAELMEYEIQLFDAVENSRLKLVSDARIYELSADQQKKLLLVKYGVNVKQEETVVTVNFIDYDTGRPVASCRGAYSSLGVAGASHDIKEAIKRVAKQIAETFS
ncbi:MAG: hypothetical protein K2L91_04435 [Duncaniella sp.]|nr:hypothetical protein [Duncaniella sp.]MDE6169732.1 hypothetical protein [Duncaniella sp.]MDE6327756.1 hypothetical protein [Duncaniella sp.]MDE6466012.1 hypothetical protein [Duncaniella sp.]MDE6573000.1 hypothetical protein [Duncaniella sp.]